MKGKTIKVHGLARVEGEGSIHIKLKGNDVADVKFEIFEPPRFFEAFLRGRHFTETPDITARICGICPIAYQMSSVHAMEAAIGVQVTGQLRALRRLIYCGEWIESHALHIYMLHAPDFLGYEDAIRMAKDHPDTVKRGLRLKKTGNEIVRLLGGREIHPVNVKVGGFYRVPTRKEFAPLKEELKWARDAAIETARWVAQFTFPDFEQDYEFVAVKHPDEYPFNEGLVVSNRGIDIPVEQYEQVFVEEHVAHSTALHSYVRRRGNYFTGPMARYALCDDQLSPLAKEVAREIGLDTPCRNPFKSIIVRAVETVYACDEAIRIIDQYEQPDKPAVDCPAKAGIGHAATEAPRGLLYHRYKIDDAGLILEAKIVPPTSQNQKTIESDLKHFIPSRLHLAHDELTWQCEQAVRNYDPCISCSCHFLKLHFERE
jgi:coenzyme F420-reducing hydrogenase alpha subunit